MDIDQIVEIEEHHIEVEVSMDKIIEEHHVMSITTEMILEEKISEIHKIIVDTEEIIEMIVMKEIEVGLEIDNIQIIPEGMTKVTVGLDQVQELVQTGIELDATNVGNMIILLRTWQVEKESEQIQQMYNTDKEQTALSNRYF